MSVRVVTVPCQQVLVAFGNGSRLSWVCVCMCVYFRIIQKTNYITAINSLGDHRNLQTTYKFNTHTHKDAFVTKTNFIFSL